MRGGEKVEDGGREEGPDGEGPEGDQGDHGGGQGDSDGWINKQVLRTIMLIKMILETSVIMTKGNLGPGETFEHLPDAEP